jgi:hypothetical protein
MNKGVKVINKLSSQGGVTFNASKLPELSNLNQSFLKKKGQIWSSKELLENLFIGFTYIEDK